MAHILAILLAVSLAAQSSNSAQYHGETITPSRMFINTYYDLHIDPD